MTGAVDRSTPTSSVSPLSTPETSTTSPPSTSVVAEQLTSSRGTKAKIRSTLAHGLTTFGPLALCLPLHHIYIPVAALTLTGAGVCAGMGLLTGSIKLKSLAKDVSTITLAPFWIAYQGVKTSEFLKGRK